MGSLVFICITNGKCCNKVITHPQKGPRVARPTLSVTPNFQSSTFTGIIMEATKMKLFTKDLKLRLGQFLLWRR